jgi:hypothetical protein
MHNRFSAGTTTSLPSLLDQALRWVAAASAASVLALTGCGGKADTPTTVVGSASTTATPATSPAQAVAPTPPISLNCDAATTTEVGQYMADNNTWGNKGVVGWSQCMGGVLHPKGGVSAQWTWDWKYEGDNVKAYPEVVFGQKPGYPKSTTTLLPRKLSSMQTIAVDYDVQVEREGAGNMAIDMWLTNIPNPTTFAAPPITHEVMVWLEVYGPMFTGGQQVDKVRINGTLYRVFVGEKFGLGWRYVAFAPNSPMQTSGHMDMMPFFMYLKGKGLITTEEFLATVNFGNEIISGAGETKLNRFAVTVN